MADKIEVYVGKEYGEKPAGELVSEIGKRIKEKYPGYRLAWITEYGREKTERDLEMLGAQEAKVVELEINVLPFMHCGILVPENESLLGEVLQ